jgi:hypothetical protein
MYIGLHVKYRYFCQTLMKIEFSQQIFEKYSNIKFHENPSSGRRDVPYGRIDRRTDMTKVIVAFRNLANAPTNRVIKLAKLICLFCVECRCRKNPN